MEPVIHYPKVKRELKAADPAEPGAGTPATRQYPPLAADLLLNYYSKHPHIKLVEAVCPFDPNIILRDASFSLKMKEDDLYLKDSEALVRLRRGNSFVIYKDGAQSPTVQISRRGLPKFFDLRQEHIRVMKGETSQQDLIKFGATCAFEYRIIMNAVAEKLQGKCLVNLYRSGKANGENAQVSSVTLPSRGDCWVVCSKNVSLLFQRKDQIDLYTEERFAYARLIAHQWNDFFSTLAPEAQAKLRDATKSNTLVGEYCGHSLCQHLVKYDQVKIIFYAVVPKDCAKACWSMQETFKFFDEVGLEKVRLEAVENLSDLRELAVVLEKMNSKLALSSVQEEGEGSVAYIEVFDPAKNTWEVLSMCKLKTLEYRFLRKMREKIKKQIRNGGPAASTVSKFEKECKELCEEYPKTVQPDLPSIQEYSLLLETGIRVAEASKIPVLLLEKCFLDVLQLIRACHKENRLATKKEVALLLDSLPGETAAGEEGSENEAAQNKQPPINIVYLDIPGLFDPSRLKKELDKAGVAIKIKYGYEQKKSKTHSFRIVNLNKTPLNLKKLKPYTFILIPSIGEAGDSKTIGRELIKRVSEFFLDLEKTDPGLDCHKELHAYLHHVLSSLSKPSHIEQAVFVSISKLAKVKREKDKITSVEVCLDDFESRLVQTIQQMILDYANSKVVAQDTMEENEGEEEV